MRITDFFDSYGDVNWNFIENIPCFKKLAETPHSLKWHKEGSPMVHTKNVVNEMIKILDSQMPDLSEDMRRIAIAGAICHDLGKAETTKWNKEKQDYGCFNHGAVGERITRKLLWYEDILIRECVCYMVRHHMTLHHIFDKPELTEKKFQKLHYGMVPFRLMLALNEADSRGSKNDIETEDMITEKIEKIKQHMPLKSDIKWNDVKRSFSDYDGEVDNTKGDFKVIVLIGLPGSGKSTLAKNYLGLFPKVSRDDIRGELGIGGATPENGKKVVGTKEEEEKVSEIFNERVIRYCEEGKTFVIDNTNLRTSYRMAYNQLVMKYNPMIVYYYVETPHFDDSMNRRFGQIGEQVYDRMWKSFDFPQLYECDELHIMKQVRNEHTSEYVLMQYEIEKK